ncbi:MAG: hypothetical protein KJO07_14645, partial [Deltaproteobacteria bacterium]|nr:hypothetical protein [Deltaproteobacteria bacterium]
AGGYGEVEHRQLAARQALGASDLEGALDWARTHSKRYARLAVVTDGVATAGGTTADELRKAAKALGESGVRRLDAIATGGIRDEALLTALVTAGLKSDGAVIDGDRTLPEIADRLTRQVSSKIPVVIPGASWVWPKQLDALQAGDEALVYFGLPADSALQVEVGGTKDTPEVATLAKAPRPLLHRAAAGARIAAMLAERDALPAKDTAGRDALKKRIIGLSTRHRVMSPFTALLVLETEVDYARFNIDRKALADILTIGEGGLSIVDRRTTALPPKGTEQPMAVANETESDDESKADEKAEDIGGTGTKMALEEGKMGRKESTRATGQYAMKNNNAEPQLAKQQAIESAREAGVLGTLRGNADGVASGAASSDQRPARRPRPRPRPGPASRPPPPAEPRSEGEDIDDMLNGGGGRQAPKKTVADPYTGKMAEVMKLLPEKPTEALAMARAWRSEKPGDVMALVALGESLEKTGDLRGAARAYGSIIDLFAARADLRRFAGQRLERLRLDEAAELAVDTFRHAAEERPDHPSSHRLLAFALVRAGRPAEAFEALETGLKTDYPSGRFAGAERILGEDLGLVAEAWVRAEPGKRQEVLGRLRKAGGKRENRPSLRFVLSWETDANDVDFHIYDGKNNHAYYRQQRLASGGDLYADVTTGYGPECFTIRGKPRAFPYTLQAHYYRRGPMGYGMGKLEVVWHDGRGKLTFEQRPFLIMKDGAFVDLGVVKAVPK